MRSLSQNRWFILAWLVLSLVLFGMVLANMNGRLPKPPGLQHRPAPDFSVIPVHKLDELFAAPTHMRLLLSKELVHPFHTTYFQPRPAKPAAKQKVEFVYQGYYETAAGQKQAFVKAGEQVHVAKPGDLLAGDWSVSEVHLRRLILTNRSAKTMTLEFKHPQSLELPAP